MLLDIFVYVALFGGVGLAIYSVYKRVKNPDPNAAGYVYNGKTWVTWLFVITVLAILFFTFIMPLPIISEHRPYRPEWGGLGLLFYAVLLYVCYSVIAFVPATAEEIEASKESGNTVMGTVGSTASSVFKLILGMIGGILLAIPKMIGEALNPTLAIKTIGNTVYKVVGTGVTHAITGIVAMGFLVILAAVAVMFAAMFLALFGTFALGIIAVIKFFKNIFYKMPQQPVGQQQPVSQPDTDNE